MNIISEYQISLDLPAWLVQQQAHAWEQFLKLPQPTRHDEQWRFSNLKILDLARWHLASAPANVDALLARSQGSADLAAKLVFANERLISREIHDLPEGVLLLPLEEAARDHEALFQRYFMKHPALLGSAKIAALHRAQLQTGVFLYVPAGVKIEKPIELWHWSEGDHAAIFPHTLVVCEERSSASVIDHFFSMNNEASFVAGVNDLIVKADAHLKYIAVQNWSRETTAFHLNTTDVGKNAVATSLQLNLGGRYIRTESNSRLLEEGARSVMLSINPIDADGEIDQRTFQDHLAPSATSDLLYHNALDDRSRSVFSGLIKVGTAAHETDAYQKVRNLMLSDEAEANSMPGLEILADRVRCSHGATSGELNQDELFYMMARGIPPQKAAKLIVRGFFETVLRRLEEPSLEKYFGQLLNQRLGLD
ncbi:MAG: Fe-S cluster assembly protein SufD [Verrucomicrobiae bacterium]|nr:Fe-S cluster assembly protein SufD [Verrucomicrobiae bacterium]